MGEFNAFSTAARNRAYFFFLCELDRLWLRSRARGACAALGFACRLSQEDPDCGFRRHSPAWRARTGAWLASFPQALEAKCAEPQFPSSFRIREATDKTVQGGGMANGLVSGRPTVPGCGGGSRVDPLLPSLLPLSANFFTISKRRLDETLARCDFPRGCARLHVGQDKPGGSQQVHSQLWARLGPNPHFDCCWPWYLCRIHGTCASEMLANLLGCKRWPIRALELQMSA